MDPDARGADTYVLSPSPAVTADSADDVSFSGNSVTNRNVPHPGTDLHHLTVTFMLGNERGFDVRSCPGVPGLDVQIGAADANGHHSDLHVGFVEAWFGLLGELETLLQARFE